MEEKVLGGGLALWFSAPYNAWYVGKIKEINRRRTVSENVAVEFVDEQYGETVGHIVADKDTYGADRSWVVLKPIPIELDSEDEAVGGGPSDLGAMPVSQTPLILSQDD